MSVLMIRSKGDNYKVYMHLGEEALTKTQISTKKKLSYL